MELINAPVELVAGICLKHVTKIAVTECPNVFLNLVVFKSRNWVNHLIVHSNLSDFRAPCSVHRVVETWMVSLLYAVTLRQNPFADVVKVINVYREPRNGLRAYFRDSFRYCFKLFHRSLNVLVFKGSVEVDIKVY